MKKTRDTSYIDELTDAYNRRHLNETVRHEIKAYIAKHVPFIIAWVDIDHFKSINDTYGHLKGDEVIKDLANFICLGEMYLEQGEIAKTKLMLDRASEIGQTSRDMLMEVYMLFCKYFLSTGDLHKFTETLAFVEDIQQETESKSLKAAINVLYGRCYTQTRAYDRAAEHLQNALEMYTQLKHTLSTGQVYYYMGLMEKEAGKNDFAKKDFEKARGLFETVGAKQWEKWTTTYLDQLVEGKGN